MKRALTNRQVTLAALFVVPALLIGACAEDQSTQPTLERNPYGISDAKLDAALGSLHQALADSALLNSMTQPKPNPYAFQAADTIFAHEKLDAAVEFSARLQSAREQSNYSILDSCMTTFDAYVLARPYWEEEARRLNEEVLVFWRGQRELADSTQLIGWIEFTAAMVQVESTHVAMVDAILTDMDRDAWGSWEEAADIVNRKIARQDLEIVYYSGLIRCLMQGIVLRVPDYRRLGDFVASYSSIRSGLRYWRKEMAATRDSTLPFLGGELLRADKSGNEAWGEFVRNMIEGAHERDTFATASIVDLSADSVLVLASGRESAARIINRKTILNMHQRVYYRRLVALVSEGRALAVLHPPVE